MIPSAAYDPDKRMRAQTGPAVATLALIVACVVCYSRGLSDPTLSCSYDNIFHHGRWWCVFTALFVHGSLMHLLGNLLFLYLFGKGLERQIGPLGLLAVFAVGGVASMIFCSFYYPHNMPCVGASGAICTILATLMLFDPWKFSLLLNLLPMPLGVAGFTYLLVNIAGFYQDLKHPTAGGMHTAYAGHLSGFAAGMVIGMVICPNWQKNLLLSILQFVGYYLLLWGIWYFFLR